ncbi:MAG: hypothetical protein ACHQ53_09270 [Polyangiales bacterium]
MNKRTLRMAALLLAVGAFGCGTSNKPGMEDAGDSGLGDSGKPDSGKPDSGPSMTMTMTAMPVPCGSNTCQPPASLGDFAGGLGGMAAGGLGGLGGGGGAMACCVDQSTGQCGMSMGGTCNPPPTPDPRCPSLNVFGMMIAGCCISDMCGVDASALGMGCAENGGAKAALAATGLGGFIMIPDAQACDASGAGHDAGSDMMMSGGGDTDAGH